MPAGVTWPVYLRFMTAAMLTMFAGAQGVHSVYNPLADLDEMVIKEAQRMRDEAEGIRRQRTDSQTKA